MWRQRSVALAFVGALFVGTSSSLAGTRAFAVEHVDIITGPGGESRILLGLGELSGFENAIVTSAFLDFTLPAVAPASQIDLRVHTLETSWSSGDVTWTYPWEEPGGDLGDAEPSVTLERSQEISRLSINVTSAVRGMVRGDVAQNGFLFTTADREREGFSRAERELLATLSEGKLVVTYANALPAGRDALR